MEQPNGNINWGNIFKIIVFICGGFLGLASKLVVVNKQDKLTMKVAFYNLVMTASATWVAWFLLKKVNADDSTKFICAFLVSRFSDSFIRLVYMWFLKNLKQLSNELGDGKD